ncbi:MAG: DUF4492 domain-containing protein [Bacteroidia bacterium]|nr:DUF4492 domain-containing protein [Bacteroidia bacterium]
MKKFILNAGSFYLNSLRNPGKLGKNLIIILLIKLFVMFIVLKLFFFKDFLSTHFTSDEQKSEYVINSLTK